MNKFVSILIALIASAGIYPVTGVVTEVDRKADTVTFTTPNGHMYTFSGCEDWASNDLVSALMYDNRTPQVFDDIILSARYSGTAEKLPEAFPHRREFERDFARDFPGSEYELFGQNELTARTLESRRLWDYYVVEVVSYTVIDAYHAKSDKGNPASAWDMAAGHYAPGEEYAPGSKGIAYLVYEIHSDGEDDIIARYDYLLH